MIDIPFWVFFWMATVLIQAFLHYGLIGRRGQYGYREEDDIEILTEEIVESESEVENDDKQGGEKTRAKLESTNRVDLAEHDKHEVRRMSLLQQIEQESNLNFKNDRTSKIDDEGSHSPINVSAYNDDDQSDIVDPADENDYYNREYNSSSEEYDKEKDGKWRYELMMDYYSSAYSDENEQCDDDQSITPQDTLNLKVVPTPLVKNDIVYENGKIRWGIKRKQPLKGSTFETRSSKRIASSHVTSVRRRNLDKRAPLMNSYRQTGVLFGEQMDESRNTKTPLTQ